MSTFGKIDVYIEHLHRKLKSIEEQVKVRELNSINHENDIRESLQKALFLEVII